VEKIRTEEEKGSVRTLQFRIGSKSCGGKSLDVESPSSEVFLDDFVRPDAEAVFCAGAWKPFRRGAAVDEEEDRITSEELQGEFNQGTIYWRGKFSTVRISQLSVCDNRGLCYKTSRICNLREMDKLHTKLVHLSKPEKVTDNNNDTCAHSATELRP